MDYNQVCEIVGQLYLKLYEVQLELDKAKKIIKEAKENAAD